MLSATQIGMPGGLPMPLEWLLRGSSRSGGDALTLTPRPDPVRQDPVRPGGVGGPVRRAVDVDMGGLAGLRT